MIRPACPTDTPAILDIWLRASALAHDFIPLTFWEAQLADMEHLYLPQAQTFVLELEGRVQGFVSLVEDYLAALFVQPAAQGCGHGAALLRFAQQQRAVLTLCVYAENRHAVGFYQAQGFETVEERQEPNTGHPERVMVWQQRQAPSV